MNAPRRPDRRTLLAVAGGLLLLRPARATPEALAGHLARQCLPDPLMPEDVVGGCLFLASDISRAMTGQALVIDGGVVVTG